MIKSKETGLLLFLGIVGGLYLNLIDMDLVFASANQINRKVSNIESNLTSLAQAVAGIGLIIGVIIWNTGNPEIGKMTAKGAGFGIVVTFMLPTIISFLKTMGG